MLGIQSRDSQIKEGQDMGVGGREVRIRISQLRQEMHVVSKITVNYVQFKNDTRQPLVALLTKFPQFPKFRQICQFRQQHFVKSAIFFTACISAWTYLNTEW